MWSSPLSSSQRCWPKTTFGFGCGWWLVLNDEGTFSLDLKIWSDGYDKRENDFCYFYFIFLSHERLGTKFGRQKCQGISSKSFVQNTTGSKLEAKISTTLNAKLKKFCFVQQAREVIKILRSVWLHDQSDSGKLIRWCYGLGLNVGGKKVQKKKNQLGAIRVMRNEVMKAWAWVVRG